MGGATGAPRGEGKQGGGRRSGGNTMRAGGGEGGRKESMVGVRDARAKGEKEDFLSKLLKHRKR